MPGHDGVERAGLDLRQHLLVPWPGLARERGDVAGDDRCVRPWEVASGRELRRLDGHTGRVARVAFSPDGGILASPADNSGRIRSWDLAMDEPRYALIALAEAGPASRTGPASPRLSPCCSPAIPASRNSGRPGFVICSRSGVDFEYECTRGHTIRTPEPLFSPGRSTSRSPGAAPGHLDGSKARRHAMKMASRRR